MSRMRALPVSRATPEEDEAIWMSPSRQDTRVNADIRQRGIRRSATMRKDVAQQGGA